ncbi:MAG: hypothetical protein R2932_33920 [Caldilineaceae bacterium]
MRQAFGQMAEEVITREQNLRKQVDELQIIIDDSRRKEHVSEITESDFFRELQGRAAALRSRRGHQRADSELNVVASALG